MPRPFRTSVAALALVLAAVLASPAPAAPARDVAGHWQGSLQGMLRIVMHFERAADGSLRGTMDSPDQGAMGLALDSVTFAGDSLHAGLARVRGGYDAVLNTAGDSLLGHWRQSGVSVALVLGRSAAPEPPRRPQLPVPPYPYDTLEVAFDNPRAPGVRLAGTLTVPRGKGPFPCALLITGSGPEDRDETVFGHRPFKVLADHLTRAGIAVLRVDDRGVGGSTGSSVGATSEDFAGDVLAGVAFLRKRREVDKRRLGLIGHSEGGLIAPMVAAASRDVAFVVLLAGPGVRGDSLMLLQSQAARRAGGASEEQLTRETVPYREMCAAAVAGDSVRIAAAARALVELQLAASPGAAPPRGEAVDRLVEGAVKQVSDPWMRYFLAHDPAPALRRLRVPVLALNGSRDVQVTPRENLAGIERALEAGGNRDITVQELPGLNHLFQACRTCTVDEYARLEETLSPAALTMVSYWIRKRTTP